MSDLQALYKIADDASGGSLNPLGAMMGMIIAMAVISSIIGLIMVISLWKVFTKCGKEGWAAIIPIYNIVVMTQICELPTWYVLLMFVPFANFFVLWKLAEGFTKLFNKDDGFKFLMFFLPVVGYPMLGFGKDMPVDAEDVDDMQMGPMPMDGSAPMGGQPMGPMGPAPMGPMGPAPMGPAPMGPAPVAPVAPVAPAPAEPVAPAPVEAAPAAPAPAAPAPTPVAPLNPEAPQGPSVPPLNGTPNPGAPIPPLMGA